jgi:S1-C subfamily serine protease
MDASVELVKHLLGSVVHIHAEIPSAHPSTRHLGDERMGTGAVVDAAGFILTVNYVVMGAETIQVTLGRGRGLRAEIVAQDFEVGLALLRVKRQGLAAVQIADSESLERGAPVFAIGSTGSRERRVGGGLVTYLGEFEAHWEYMLERGIVSSAANPGFGGGPLNLNEIARCSLAIPSEYYRRNREEFVRFGRVVSRPQRAWLGVFAHVLEEGVVVADVVPNGPGARSGIQEGDVIVSLDAREVPTRKELYLSLWRHTPGEKMTLEVMRDNEVRRLSVTAGDRADFYKQIS